MIIGPDGSSVYLNRISSLIKDTAKDIREGFGMSRYDTLETRSDLDQWYRDHQELDRSFLSALVDKLAASIIAARKANPDGLTMWYPEDAVDIARKYLPDESEAVIAGVAEALWEENSK